MTIIVKASRITGQAQYIVVCTCGFESGPHMGLDTVPYVRNGHMAQCRVDG